MRQELCVGVLLNLAEDLECLLLEPDGFFKVSFLVVDIGNFEVAIADLLGHLSERHLEEFPGVCEYIQGPFKVFLSEVDLANNLEYGTV